MTQKAKLPNRDTLEKPLKAKHYHFRQKKPFPGLDITQKTFTKFELTEIL